MCNPQTPLSTNPNPVSGTTTTCIVGGGNSAHVLIPFLTKAGHRVHLLTSRPNDWKEVVRCNVMRGETLEETHSGKIDKKSHDPSEVIPDADVIVLCMPVHQYHPALHKLAPYINRNKKEVFVGTIYGQAGFNWMVHDIEKEFCLNNIVTFAVGSIPWICRTITYGESVANYGGKKVNTVAVTPPEKFASLYRIFLADISERPLRCGLFKQTHNFLSLTMSVDNQLIHPARCYGLWQQNNCQGKWKDIASVPYFYRDFDQNSAENLRRLDEDYTRIRNALKKRFPDHKFNHMLSYMELENLNHGTGNEDILHSLKNSIQLASVKTPTVPGPNGIEQLLDTNFRFFTDDIAYGLVIAKWIAEQLDVETPFIDEIIDWAQTIRGEHFLDPVTRRLDKEWCLKEKYRTGIPEAYGIFRLEDILE